VSSGFLRSRQEQAQVVDWARLIPGGTSGFRAGEKKPARSVRLVASEKVSEITTVEHAAEDADSAPISSRKALNRGVREEFAEVAKKTKSRSGLYQDARTLFLFLPGLLQSRISARGLRSVAVDFGLIALNWLFIGALQVPLRGLFPHVRIFEYAAGAPARLLGIALLQASLITLLGYAEGLHVEDCDRRGQARVLGKAVSWATILLCFAYALQGAQSSTCGLFCGAGLLHFGVLWAWRWQSAGRDHGEQTSGEVRNVLIVGAGSVGRSVASYLEGHPGGRVVCGFLDNDRPLSDKVIGRVDDLARLARMGFVDEVILAAPHDRGLIRQVLREARGLCLDVEIVPDLFGCRPAESEVIRVGDLRMICLHAERLPVGGLALKRVVDVVGAGLALTLLSPALAVIAGLIKLESPGPVLYCARRAGRKGRLFCCYKFRTMVNNADALKDQLREGNQRSGPFFKMADDPRITRLGRFLRRYSLDELPQLGNVLRGNMSLVGPRPHPLDDFAAYHIEHLARLDMTPGMTGLWQVSARRDPSFQRGMELDREYIRTWSVKSDLRILLRTFWAVAKGSGD
jgi:exopolysaccharide biosynthesis polyprenyl glycosylphosphotransferase